MWYRSRHTHDDVIKCQMKTFSALLALWAGNSQSRMPRYLFKHIGVSTAEKLNMPPMCLKEWCLINTMWTSIYQHIFNVNIGVKCSESVTQTVFIEAGIPSFNTYFRVYHLRCWITLIRRVDLITNHALIKVLNFRCITVIYDTIAHSTECSNFGQICTHVRHAVPRPYHYWWAIGCPSRAKWRKMTA